MKATLLSFLRHTLLRLLALLVLLGRSWRLWLTTSALGLVLGGGLALPAPRLWASEGTIALHPRVMLEGYLLSTQELAPSYAVRLQQESRVARILAALGIAERPVSVRATAQRGGLLHLRVTYRDPDHAEAIARALLTDFRAELEAENRSREEGDRLVVRLSPSSFARPVVRPLLPLVGGGVLAGLVGGWALVVLGAWRRRGRVLAPLEAEQLMGVPTLATIPPRRLWR